MDLRLIRYFYDTTAPFDLEKLKTLNGCFYLFYYQQSPIRCVAKRTTSDDDPFSTDAPANLRAVSPSTFDFCFYMVAISPFDGLSLSLTGSLARATW